MTPEFRAPSERDDDRISAHLCRAVGAADFDYATLVDGVHRRAGRIRRRRALTTGAIVAVFGPALLGGSAMVLPSLLPGGVGGTVVPAESPLAVLADQAEPTPLSEESPHAASTQPAETAGDAESRGETAGGVQDAPWQDGDPPLPAGGVDSADSGNAWEIPDARPTGVDRLDSYGAPQSGRDYVRTVPVRGALSGNTGLEGVRPVAGQSWMYYDENDQGGGSVDIVVTGWEDSNAARDALREDTNRAYVREGDWQPRLWDDHASDDDYLLYETTNSEGVDYAFAMVRQGDYLISVTVARATGEIDAEVVAEIASKTADNLQALDPIHGRD